MDEDTKQVVAAHHSLMTQFIMNSTKTKSSIKQSARKVQKLELGIHNHSEDEESDDGQASRSDWTKNISTKRLRFSTKWTKLYLTSNLNNFNSLYSLSFYFYFYFSY